MLNVECTECSRQFVTKKEYPSCPACGSIEIDLQDNEFFDLEENGEPDWMPGPHGWENN